MLWKKIKDEMDKQGMSAYRLSKITGLSQNTLQNYKNGHEPSFSNVCKIADALGVSLDKFRSDREDGQCIICVSVVCDYVNRDCDHERCGRLDVDTQRINCRISVYCRKDA